MERESMKPILTEAIKQMNATTAMLSKSLGARLDGKFTERDEGSHYDDADVRITNAISALASAALALKPLTHQTTTF